MNAFTAYTPEGVNKFTFDSLIKNDTYHFLHFIPTKGSLEKVKINVSLYKNNNTLIEEHDFVLEINSTGKNYNEHYIGLLQNGRTQKVIFTALDGKSNLPLNNISIGIVIAKIKDGTDDENGGGYLRPKRPKVPFLVG